MPAIAYIRENDGKSQGWFPALFIRAMSIIVMSASSGFADDISEKALVVVYLESAAAATENIEFELDSILIMGDVTPVSLKTKSRIISTSKSSGRQILLAEGYVPPGFYKSVKLYFDSVQIEIEGEIVRVAASHFGGAADIYRHFQKESSYPLFLTLTPGGLDGENNYYIIRIHTQHPAIPPPGSLMFVSNEGANNLTVMDRFNFRTVDVLNVGRGPRGMAYSQTFQLLYVANSGDNSISVIDVPSLQVLKQVYLDYGDEPSRLRLSPDEGLLFVLNYGSNSLAVFDLPALQEIDRQSIGVDPVGMAVDRYFVFISNQTSDYLTLYNSEDRSIAFSYDVSGSPSEILIDGQGNILYVAESDQQTVSVYDTQTGNQVYTINLCGRSTGMAFNRLSGILYVATDECRELEIIKTDNNLTIGRVALPGRPGQITLEPESRKLFAVIPDDDELAVVDVIGHKLQTVIMVGHRPYETLVPF